jgi:hypothetical protein
MRDNELQEYVRKKLRHSLFPSIWSLLLREQYVEDVLLGSQTPDWLVDRAREMLDSRAPMERSSAPADDHGPSLGNERLWALSQLVAHQAAEDQEVVAFRSQHLADGLVQWPEVEQWINERAEEDGERTSDVTFTIPKGTTIEWDGPTPRFNPPIAQVTDGISFSGRMIAYALPDDRAVRRRAVTAHGVLDQLGKLGETLADAFAWQPAQATVFVLTGVTPMIPAAKEEGHAFKVRHEVELGWARRIKLDIDPAASPHEVLDAFEQALNEHHQAGRRRTSLKHLRLAAFAGAEHADKSWAARHQLWNQRFPQWSYTEQSNFRRDAVQAQRRLLHP